MIPVNEPLLGERELEYVTECVRTGWISSSGRFIEEFEIKWAAYCGMNYGIAVSSGTTALQVAVGCLDLKPGDEVVEEVLRISGNGPFTSAPFKLEGKRYLRINWQQYSNGKFSLYIINLDPSMKNTQYGEVNFDLWPGPDAGSSDYEFIAGTYVISIKDSQGSWEVWLQTLKVGN
jgi:hypothetical protein